MMHSDQRSIETHPDPTISTSHRRVVVQWGVLIFLLAFAVRLMIALAIPNSFETDPDAYRRMARSIYQTGVFGLVEAQQFPDAISPTATPTAYRPVLYPWILSWFQGFQSDRIPIACLHAILGAAAVALAFDIACRLGFTRGLALGVSFMVLADPILLRQSTLVMTETLATFLALAVWWLVLVTGWSRVESRDRSVPIGIAIGIALGIACLSRPTSVAWCLLWAGWEVRKNPIRAVCLTLGCILVLLPWVSRNRTQLGHGIWTTTHGGYTLLLANNPILYEHWNKSWSREWQEERFHDWWANQQAERFAGKFPGEVEIDRFANELAWKTIWGDPIRFLKACLIREGWLWAWWPSGRQAGVASRFSIGIWYALTSVAALIGLVRLIRRQPGELGAWIPMLLMGASLCVVHAVFWSNMRMRAPIIPLVSLLAICSYRLPSTSGLLLSSDAVKASSGTNDQIVADDSRRG